MSAKRTSERRRRRRAARFAEVRAFTLVELLVVVAVVGVLVALLLPAVQSAREAARQLTCKNHLKQLALGAFVHHSQQGSFPSGGWKWGFGRYDSWTGDADRGLGPTQPGGWAFSLLPFIEQQPLFELGAGASGVDLVRAIKEREATPVPIFFCPSRRSPVVLTGDEEFPPVVGTKHLNASDAAWRAEGRIVAHAPDGPTSPTAWLVKTKVCLLKMSGEGGGARAPGSEASCSLVARFARKTSTTASPTPTCWGKISSGPGFMRPCLKKSRRPTATAQRERSICRTPRTSLGADTWPEFSFAGSFTFLLAGRASRQVVDWTVAAEISVWQRAFGGLLCRHVRRERSQSLVRNGRGYALQAAQPRRRLQVEPPK